MMSNIRLAWQERGLDSVVHHDLLENKGADFSLVSKQNIWKYRYGARNKSYFFKRRGLVAWLGFFIFANERLRHGRVPLSMCLAVNIAILRGLMMKVQIEMVE